MIRQNIKMATIIIIGLLTLWLILFNFIKLDITTQGVVTFVDSFNYLMLDRSSAAYIENHDIDYVKFEYNKQYFDCHITYASSSEESQTYLIFLPTIVDKTKPYLTANIIIDSLNVYQYWIKK